jgi:hypothetical protein
MNSASIKPKTWSQRQRLLATLNRQMPDRFAFITRLETWYKSHTRSNSLPPRFHGMTLQQVHQAVGVGQLKFMVPYALKLRQVEVLASFEGEPFFREYEPTIENFPGMWDLVSTEKAGETVTELRTPVGNLRLRHAMLPEGVYNGTDPYLKEHLIKDSSDLAVVEYILERAEYIPLYNKISAEQERLGEMAFVVPLLHRIPFQQVLLEYFGEIHLFYNLHDNPNQVQRLLKLLDLQMMEFLDQLKGFDWPYVEFPDNLHGMMTNPRLFSQYCLPGLQKYTDLLHRQGKKVGSHTDGNVKPLLKLLAESGLDVCESFSPYPLTECTFEEAWRAWSEGPLIWGGIPTPLLEKSTSESDFRQYIDKIFGIVGNQPIIFGVVDLFLRHNSIERVEYIARQIESNPL